VYIAALAPAENETVADVSYRAKPHREAPNLQPDVHGFIWMPKGGFARAVAHKASADQTAILEAVQRPIAMKHSRDTSCAGVENEALVVFLSGRGPHDCAGNAALYGQRGWARRFGHTPCITVRCIRRRM
jgi:hypothetical protein